MNSKDQDVDPRVGPTGCGSQPLTAEQQPAQVTDAKRTEHTPGPWRLWLSADDPGCFRLEGDSPEPHGNNMIIVKRDIGTPNGDEGVANARLIAAAPELLIALRDLIDAIPEPTLVDDPPLRVWVSLAKAVIARAEGSK